MHKLLPPLEPRICPYTVVRFVSSSTALSFLTLRYMDNSASQLLPQLTFIRVERGLRPLFPHRRRSPGPLACAAHTFRPFSTASQADAFHFSALLHRAQPTERDLCFSILFFLFEKNGGSTAFYSHLLHLNQQG